MSTPAVRIGRAGAPVGLGAAVLGAGLFAALLVAAVPSSPLIPVVLVGVVGLFVAAVLRPLDVICLGLLAVPLEGFSPGLIGPSQGILGVATMGWIVSWAASTPGALPRSPAIAWLTAVIVANLAGLLFAPEPFVVARQAVTWTTLGLLVGAIALRADERQLHRLLFTFVLCGGLTGFIAIVDPSPVVGGVYAGADLNRATGGFGSPNILGMLLAFLLPLQIVFALRGVAWMRVVAAVCAGLALFGMSLAVSRASFIGLGAAIVVLAFWAPFRGTALVLAPLVVVLAMVGHNPASPISHKIVERVTSDGARPGPNPRLALWRAAPRMIEDRPVFGQGALEYSHYSPGYGLTTIEGTSTHAHDLLITITVETGIVGLVAFLGFLATLGACILRIIRHGTGTTRALGFGLAAAFTGFLVNGILDYALSAAPIAAVFFLLAGCAIALALRVTPTTTRTPRHA